MLTSRTHIGSYTEPQMVDLHPGWGGHADQRATVIVREGYGAIGLRDAWSAEELAAGMIPFRLVRATREELTLLDEDRRRALLPRLREQTSNDEEAP